MEDRTKIFTPDRVELEFELAGFGSRGAAFAVDLILRGLIFLVVILLFSLFVQPFLWTGDGMTSLGIALLILAYFLLNWGYFVFFETLMRGQSPGKRVMGIRVVRENGLPVGVRESLLRNLLRAADMLPPPTYLLGGLVALKNPRGQRFGDMAAGTMVVREQFGLHQTNSAKWSGQWVARLERGESRHALVLPSGTISVGQINVFDRYLERGALMPVEQRTQLALRLASPYLEMFDLDPEEVRNDPNPLRHCEAVISKLVEAARSANGEASVASVGDPVDLGEEKNRLWDEFGERVERLHKRGRAALKRLTAPELETLLDDYRKIVLDLSRAQSMGADPQTLTRLNRLAVSGHNLLYGQVKSKGASGDTNWWSGFARLVRQHLWAVALAGAFLFLPAAISYGAIMLHPDLAFEIVAPDFLDFQPAREDNLHDIPSLARPIAATSIMTNNIQVTLLAFGLGLTFGLGTAFILLFNGVHIGGVAAWLTLNGNGRAFWGWVMPHGGTELLAIVLAGAAGFLLARALVAPGRLRRAAALQSVALKALHIELGCMVMLVFAAMIEGFISPSGLAFQARIVFLAFSLVLWLGYFCLAGRGSLSPGARQNNPNTDGF